MNTGRLFILLICITGTLCQNWEEIPSVNEPPTPTALGGMAAIDGKVYYFGGARECNGTGLVCVIDPCVNLFYNDLHSFDLQTQTWSYNIDSSSPTKPSVRSTFGYIGYPERNLFLVYGGATFEGEAEATCDDVFLGGLWAFNTVTKIWTLLDNPSDPNSPGARADASLLIYNDLVYLTCGLKSPGILENDVRTFNFTTNLWSVDNAGGNSPGLPAKRYHQIAVVDDGCTHNDNEWYKCSGDHPCNRDNARFIMAWGDNYLFGAIIPHINDIWQYTFSNKSWTLLEYGSKKANYHVIAAIYNNKFLIAGGDVRPREFNVNLFITVGSKEVDGSAVIQLANGTQVLATTQNSEGNYIDPVTFFESATTQVHYVLDITPNGYTKDLQQVFPRITAGEFKMSAFAMVTPKLLAVRGGYGFFCAKYAPRCEQDYLQNVYLVHLDDIPHTSSNFGSNGSY